MHISIISKASLGVEAWLLGKVVLDDIMPRSKCIPSVPVPFVDAVIIIFVDTDARAGVSAIGT